MLHYNVAKSKQRKRKSEENVENVAKKYVMHGAHTRKLLRKLSDTIGDQAIWGDIDAVIKIAQDMTPENAGPIIHFCKKCSLYRWRARAILDGSVFGTASLPQISLNIEKYKIQRPGRI